MALKDNPTLLQIHYLEDLRRFQQAGEKCSVVRIAEKNGVTHGPVSRFFKKCMTEGLLTESYELTERGALWLQDWLDLREGLREYFSRLGMGAAEIEENLRDMLENVSFVTLKMMLEEDKMRQKHQQLLNHQKGGVRVPSSRVRELISVGRYPVNFLFLKASDRGRQRSMADLGFEKPGILRCSRRGIWLELKIKEMEAPSGLDGSPQRGHLQTLKYEDHGELRAVSVDKDKVSIPFDAFSFICLRTGQFIGILYAALSCSAGEEHMPESTAQMIFWL